MDTAAASMTRTLPPADRRAEEPARDASAAAAIFLALIAQGVAGRAAAAAPDGSREAATGGGRAGAPTPDSERAGAMSPPPASRSRGEAETALAGLRVERSGSEPPLEASRAETTDARPNGSAARRDEGAGSEGSRAGDGGATTAAGSGGATGGSRGPHAEGFRERTSTRPPSLSSPGAAGAEPEAAAGRPVRSAADAAPGAQAGSTAGRAGGAASGPAAPGGLTPGGAALVSAASAAAAFAGSASAAARTGLPGAAVPVQVARALQFAILAGQREALVTLEPPELGQIRLHVRVVDGLVFARVRAERAEVERLLGAEEGAIRDRLALQGLRLEALVIERAARAPAGSSQADTAGAEGRGVPGQASRQPGEQEARGASGEAGPRRDGAGEGGGAAEEESGSAAATAGAPRVDLRA